jgi:hypothetical protein
MRHVSMQVLTWGTIGAAVASALWLAAFDRQPAGFFVAEPWVERIRLPAQSAQPVQPAQSGLARQPGSDAQPGNLSPTTTGNASADHPGH